MKKDLQPQSTYDRLMQNPDFKEKFEIEYQQFALSEIILQLMEEEKISVSKLAKTAGISPTVIQDIRSGNGADITLFHVTKILKVLGSRMMVQIGNQYAPLGG